jgi:hypothetical protein
MEPNSHDEEVGTRIGEGVKKRKEGQKPGINGKDGFIGKEDDLSIGSLNRFG